VFVTFALLCRPWLLKKQGAMQWLPDEIRVPAAFSVGKPAGRQNYLRARLISSGGRQVVEMYPNQSSGILFSASWGNGFAIIPPGEVVAEGELVRFLPYEFILH